MYSSISSHCRTKLFHSHSIDSNTNFRVIFTHLGPEIIWLLWREWMLELRIPPLYFWSWLKWSFFHQRLFSLCSKSIPTFIVDSFSILYGFFSISVSFFISDLFILLWAHSSLKFFIWSHFLRIRLNISTLSINQTGIYDVNKTCPCVWLSSLGYAT